jgi:hypothetical protein
VLCFATSLCISVAFLSYTNFWCGHIGNTPCTLVGSGNTALQQTIHIRITFSGKVLVSKVRMCSPFVNRSSSLIDSILTILRTLYFFKFSIKCFCCFSQEASFEDRSLARVHVCHSCDLDFTYFIEVCIFFNCLFCYFLIFGEKWDL